MREAKKESNMLVELRNEANEEYLRAAVEHSKHLAAVREAHQEWFDASVRLIEAKSDVQGLEERASAIFKQRDVEQAKLKEATESAQEHHAEASRLRGEVQERRAKYGDEFTKIAAGKTAAQVQDDIGAEEEKLGMISDVPQNTLQKYEQEKTAISRLEKQLGSRREKIAEVSGDIDELRGSWEPEVDELVDKVTRAFSYNFEKIGCQGEVRLHKDEDFEKWALHVMVSYRWAFPPYVCMVSLKQALLTICP